jgi:hypothetical protein
MILTGLVPVIRTLVTTPGEGACAFVYAPLYLKAKDDELVLVPWRVSWNAKRLSPEGTWAPCCIKEFTAGATTFHPGE